LAHKQETEKPGGPGTAGRLSWLGMTPSPPTARGASATSSEPAARRRRSGHGGDAFTAA